MKRHSTLADLPPESDHDYSKIARPIEEGTPLCPHGCGMDADAEPAKHTPGCKVCEMADVPWSPPEGEEKRPGRPRRLIPVGRRPMLPPPVLVPQLAAPAPVALLPPGPSGEQLALIPFPLAPLPVMAAQVAMPARALSFDQVRPSVIEIAVNAPAGTDIRVAINLTGGAV